jgi:hypothetical protein
MHNMLTMIRNQPMFFSLSNLCIMFAQVSCQLKARRSQLKNIKRNEITKVCLPRAGGDPFGWIPACAGMTESLWHDNMEA